MKNGIFEIKSFERILMNDSGGTFGAEASQQGFLG